MNLKFRKIVYSISLIILTFYLSLDLGLLGFSLFLSITFAEFSFILLHIYANNNYNNKIFYIILMSIIVLQVLLLIYVFISKTTAPQNFKFYLLLGFSGLCFCFTLFYFIHNYPKKPEELPA